MLNEMKFDIILNNKHIYDLDEFKEYFEYDLKSVYNYYIDGRLQRWLKFRGYNNELDELLKIEDNSSLSDKIKQIASIFKAEISDISIKRINNVIDIKEKLGSNYNEYIKSKEYKNKVITDYFEEYNFKIEELIENYSNIGKVNDILTELCSSEYIKILELSISSLLEKILDTKPNLVYNMLKNGKIRDLVIKNMTPEMTLKLPIEINELTLLKQIKFKNKITITSNIIILDVDYKISGYNLFLTDMSTKNRNKISELIGFLPPKLSMLEKNLSVIYSSNKKPIYTKVKKLILYKGVEIEGPVNVEIKITYLEV